MIVLGLTGSIGMGKTTAAQMLARLGVPVHDSDKAVHAALEPGGDAFEEVAVTFPKAWDKKEHLIKRDVLGDIVFSDAKKRRELEQIIHPKVQASQTQFLMRARRMGRRMAALDIPLLFETGADRRVDVTVVVTAPYHVQRRRVLSRPDMDEQRFLDILNAQMPDAQKRSKADFTVQTGLGYGTTFRALQKIISGLSIPIKLEDQEENVVEEDHDMKEQGHA